MSFNTGDRVRLTQNYGGGNTPGTLRGDTGTVLSVFDSGIWRILVKFDDYYSRLVCGDYELELIEPKKNLTTSGRVYRGRNVAEAHKSLKAAITALEAAFPELVEED